MNLTAPDVTTHRARWVVPVEGPPLENGRLVVRGERIVAVDASREVEGRLVDHGGCVIVPGFVNAHTHLEFSSLDAPLGHPGMSFPDWILTVLEYRRSPGFDAERAIFAGLSQATAFGTTTIGDIGSCLPMLLLDRPPQAADVTTFVELIGLADSRTPSQLERLRTFLGRAETDARRGISPHAPYTVRASLLEAAVHASAEQRLPLAFHLAESREELQLLAEGAGKLVDYMRTLGAWDDSAVPRGSRPLDYLRLLAAAHRSLVIHGNYLAGDEIEFLAQNRERMTTIYCPRTHAYFGHDRHPLPKLLAAGASVAIGTDGRCTNPDLNLLAELRHVARTYPEIAPADVLRLGTLAGAEALGLAHEVGSLVAGKRADFVVVQDSWEHDPVAAPLTPEASVCGVWHRGRQVTEMLT